MDLLGNKEGQGCVFLWNNYNICPDNSTTLWCSQYAQGTIHCKYASNSSTLIPTFVLCIVLLTFQTVTDAMMLVRHTLFVLSDVINAKSPLL